MADGLALQQGELVIPGKAGAFGPLPGQACAVSGVTITASRTITDVEAPWRSLEAAGVESPGQSFDFIRLWVDALHISEADQFYLVAALDGVPLALLALHRRSILGLNIYGWFPGAHVGCNGPLVDTGRLAAMSPEQRGAVWRAMRDALKGADLISLASVPHLMVEGVDLFAELGRPLELETLYRARFSSWDEANTTQRSKSRRKHDRQQGERLEAMGRIEFDEIGNGPEAVAVLDTMFAQRAARFGQMGVADPFAPAEIRRFYDQSASAGSGVRVRLHVLKLNGEIVAVRYNIAHGERLFCLISSMSIDPSIQPGSPGKQCLLRVMQTVFDAGSRVFDMGGGFSDEKRHWCNVQIALRQHDLPLSWQGGVALLVHRTWQVARQRVKSSATLLRAAKFLRAALVRRGGRASAEAASE